MPYIVGKINDQFMPVLFVEVSTPIQLSFLFTPNILIQCTFTPGKKINWLTLSRNPLHNDTSIYTEESV